MRSGVVIGAAMAVLTVRLVAGANDEPPVEPQAVRAASAAAALLAGTAAPARAAADSAASAGVHLGARSSAGAAADPGRDAGPRSGLDSGPDAGRGDMARLAAGRQLMRAASVEAEVRERRSRGEGEDAVYRARAAQLPAADVAQLMAMEAAEAEWQRQLKSMPADCAAPCGRGAAAPEHVVASAYQHDAAPRLTLE